MTLNQLRVFAGVCRHTSITRAAEALRISEPSVFQQVKSAGWQVFSAADANEPSRHREFTRAIPAAAIPDAGAGSAMSCEIEFLRCVVRAVKFCLVHALQPCKIPRRAVLYILLIEIPTPAVTVTTAVGLRRHTSSVSGNLIRRIRAVFL